MAGEDILTDTFVLELSKQADLGNVTPKQFGVILGLSGAAGNAAAIGANVVLNPHSAFDKLISKYVMIHGRKSESALKLRQIFLDSEELKPCADFIQVELEKNGIACPGHAETVIGQQPNLPSPPSDPPGYETPVAPTPSGLQPRDRPVERQQQPPSISRGTISKVVFVAIIAILTKFVYDFLSRLLGGE